MSAPTVRGGHDPLADLAPPREPEFRPGRTLRLRVELARQVKRRRTQVTALLVVALPIIVALAFKFGGTPQRDSTGPTLVDLATKGGLNFALFVEFAASGFLLVVLVALFCGDTIASEASWSSLRYLLAIPVPRARLLRQKLIVALELSFAVNLALPVWSLAVGTAFFGSAPITSPVTGSFDYPVSFARMGIVVGYVCVQALVVAALAFLLSVYVDNPLGAVGGATLLVVVSNIIDQITALGTLRHYLPTHFSYSWLDALNPDVSWSNMLAGFGLAIGYAAVLLAWAWVHFDRKDITS